MSYDLVVRGGTIVDGSGLPRYRADVGVNGSTIVAVGRIDDAGRREVDAEGLVVTPGFVDGHTHMDAQVFWDPIGSCSCYHGVTSVVMGNCGFSLAPAPESQREFVVRNLERAEDISGEAMAAGIPWSWDSYRSYLDAVDGLPKAINYAAYVGHSALRTFVMGARAFEEASSPDDLAAMQRELRDALHAGAIGMSTSRSTNHLTPDGFPVASRLAEWSEVEQLVATMGELGVGLFELANESQVAARDPEARAEANARLRRLAVDTGVPVTFGVLGAADPQIWRDQLDLLDADRRRGRPDVRPDALPWRVGAAVVQDPPAVRPAAGVGRAARPAARRPGRAARVAPRCASAWSAPPTRATSAAPSAPRHASRATTGSTCSSGPTAATRRSPSCRSRPAGIRWRS